MKWNMSNEYKNESLGHLEAWLNDALNSTASSKEVYDSIVNTVKEEIEYHERCLKRSQDLLLMLKGNLTALEDITPVKEESSGRYSFSGGSENVYEDYWKGDISDERFDEELLKQGYEYTPDIPHRY